MATYYLINTVQLGVSKLLPGTFIDDASYDVPGLQAAGAELVASSNQTVAAAALEATQQHTARGINEDAMAAIMRSALDTYQSSTLAGEVPATRTLTAGAGMTGGGDLTANRTMDVAANADASIVVNANDIQVGVLATDAQHGVRGGGTQHAAATGSVNGFMSAADKTKLDTVQSGTSTLTNGVSPTVAATITANSRIMLTLKTPSGTVLGILCAPAADRTIGAPGSFIARSFTVGDLANANDQSTFDWLVIG